MRQNWNATENSEMTIAVDAQDMKTVKRNGKEKSRMKIEQAMKDLFGIKQNMIETHMHNDTDLIVIDMARQALELMEHIKDRPCEACEYKVDGNCTRWNCEFDEWLNEFVYRRGEPNEDRG